MSKCELEVRFDRDDRTYRPGEPVRGEVVAVTDRDVSCSGLTIELLWQTHGAGNTDRTVLDQAAVEPQQWSPGLRYRYPFAFTAPGRPLTYHGHVLNVDHYVAARADLPWAIDAKASEEYLLVAGPSSHDDYLLGSEDFTAATSPKSGLVAKAIGWLLMPLVLVLVAALLVMVLPLLLVIGGVVALRRWLAERRLGRVTVEIRAPELRASQHGGQGAAAVVRMGSRWLAPKVHAVTPGQTLRFTAWLKPRTRLDVDRATARLVGTEECRSGSGTNARTHTHTLCDERIVLGEGFTCFPGTTMELAGEIPVPVQEAYSFRAPSNSLKWKLEVAIEVPRWPDWKRDHPLALIPDEGSG